MVRRFVIAAVGALSLVAGCSSGPQQPQVTLSSTALTFGGVSVGSTSTQQITVTNSGNAPLSVSSINVAGTQSSVFTQSSDCTSPVAPNSKCIIPVTFAPSAAVQYNNATIQVADNAAGSPQSVSLSGSGIAPPAPALTVTPAALAFSSVSVGGVSTALPITLSNTGSAVLTLGAMTLGGANPSSFSTASGCGATLDPSVSCTVAVKFVPTTTGALTANLSFASNAPGPYPSMLLSGTATAAPAAAVTLAPSSLNFPTTALGTESTLSVILTNSGNATLTGIAIGFTGTNVSSFTLSRDTCLTTLAPQASCTVGVTFAPTAPAAYSAALSIGDNAANSPQQVPLAGTGTGTTSFSLSSTELTFAATAIGLTSTAQTVTLTNSGNTALNGISISSNAGNSVFQQSGTCGSSLAVGDSCSITIALAPPCPAALASTFTPHRPYSGTFTVSAASVAPQQITVEGSGVGAVPTTLSAGTVLWGADGHLDKGGIYADVPLCRQIHDLRAVFGNAPFTVLYRAWDLLGSAQGQIATLLSAGIVPVLSVITYPECLAGWDACPDLTECSPGSSVLSTKADAKAWAKSLGANMAGVVAAAGGGNATAYWIIGNEWPNQIAAFPGGYPNDPISPASWQSHDGYPLYWGALEGAVDGIKSVLPNAKIVSGVNGGGTSIGVTLALAGDLANDGYGWDYTNLHWYNDYAENTVTDYFSDSGAPDLSLDPDTNLFFNAYATLGTANQLTAPILFDEVGSSNGNNAANDANAGMNATRIMADALAKANPTSTTPGVVGAMFYQLYPISAADGDKYLFTRTADCSMMDDCTTMSGQGTEVSAWTQNTSPATNAGSATTIDFSPGSVNRGGMLPLSVTVTPENANVTLSCYVWVAYSQEAATNPSCDSATMSVQVPAGATAADYAVTVFATGAGSILAQTETFSVTQ